MEMIAFSQKAVKTGSTQACAPGEEWSGNEKGMITTFTAKAPMLEWPLKPVRLGNGVTEDVYDIPEDKAYDELRKCWPFEDESFPKKGGKLYDVHAKKHIVIDKCLILRYMDRNIIVSPYYPESGGTVIDLVAFDDQAHEKGDVIVCARKFRKKE